MENLNKKNFFDDMMHTYPEAMQDFLRFIDLYKEEVKWGLYFDSRYTKFHDIPIEMQYGIIAKWLIVKLPVAFTLRFPASEELSVLFKDDLAAAFKYVQLILSKQK